jgi:hypothetical protein
MNRSKTGSKSWTCCEEKPGEPDGTSLGATFGVRFPTAVGAGYLTRSISVREKASPLNRSGSADQRASA